MDGTAKAHQGEYGVEPDVLVEVPQVTTLLGAFAEYCKENPKYVSILLFDDDLAKARSWCKRSPDEIE